MHARSARSVLRVNLTQAMSLQDMSNLAGSRDLDGLRRTVTLKIIAHKAIHRRKLVLENSPQLVNKLLLECHRLRANLDIINMNSSKHLEGTSRQGVTNIYGLGCIQRHKIPLAKKSTQILEPEVARLPGTLQRPIQLKTMPGGVSIPGGTLM